MDIRDLSTRAKRLEEINQEIENEYQTDKKLQLLQSYKEEFNSFLENFKSFYDSSTKNINTCSDATENQKDQKIEELQNVVDSLTRKIMEEKHAYELQMEHLSYIAYNEPEKAISFLSNLHIEYAKSQRYIS